MFLYGKERRRGKGIRAGLERVISLFLLVLLVLPVWPAQAGGSSFTLLVYMTGSDLETKNQSASTDLEEMAAALPGGGAVRVLVQAGGAESWGAGLDPGKLTRLEIGDGHWRILDELEPRSMGDPDTLTDFLQWGVDCAPADHYGLILWDHGAGPLMGVCFDDLFQNEVSGADSLSLRELETALRASPFRQKKLAFLGFDACLMCTLEVAALAAPFAEYMVASQEPEPACGWDYAFLRQMTGAETGAVWGERIVRAYEKSQEEAIRTVTLSCLKLSGTEEVLAQLQAFFADLTDRITAETYPAFAHCRADTRTVGGTTTSQYDLVDLMDLVLRYENLGLKDGTGLKNAVAEMMTATFALNEDHLHGVSIYYPFYNKGSFLASWASVYQESSFSPAYRAFIQRISDYYLSDALFNRTSDYQLELREDAGSVRLSVPLDARDAEQLVHSRLLVLEKLASENYRLVYYDDQHIRTDDRAVSPSYAGEALFLVDAERNILDGPVSYFPVDQGVALYGLLYSGFHVDPARLVYQADEAGRLVLTQVLMPRSGADGMFLPVADSLDGYDAVELLSFGPQNAREGESLTSLDFSVYYPEYTVYLDLHDTGWEPMFLPEWNRNERYAYLRLTDIQGENVFSDAVEVPAWNHLHVADPQALASGAGLAVALHEGILVTGYDAGLMFDFDVMNESGQDLTLSVSRMTLAGKTAGEDRLEAFRFLLPPGETERVRVFLSLASLREMNLPSWIREGVVTFTLQKKTGEEAEHTAAFALSLDSSVYTVPGD